MNFQAELYTDFWKYFQKMKKLESIQIQSGNADQLIDFSDESMFPRNFLISPASLRKKKSTVVNEKQLVTDMEVREFSSDCISRWINEIRGAARYFRAVRLYRVFLARVGWAARLKLHPQDGEVFWLGTISKICFRTWTIFHIRTSDDLSIA